MMSVSIYLEKKIDDRSSSQLAKLYVCLGTLACYDWSRNRYLGKVPFSCHLFCADVGMRREECGVEEEK